MGVRLISASWAQKRLFLFIRQHVRRIHEKIFSGRFERTDGFRLISASWAQKRFIPTF